MIRMWRGVHDGVGGLTMDKMCEYSSVHHIQEWPGFQSHSWVMKGYEVVATSHKGS